MHRFLYQLRLPRTPRARWAVITTLVGVVLIGVIATAYFLRPVVYDYTLTVPARDEKPDVQLQYGSKPALTDYTFFQKVRDRFINQDAQFLSVNLNDMEIELWEDGSKRLTVPIKAKGDPGSWWQTPAGLYKIHTKERDHITSFGGLHMPWSMQFHGNFFIHGWPYFDDGREVTGDTSAGCIRLANADARELYKHVNRGTPVLVYEKSMTGGDRHYSYTSQDLDVSADTYLIADIRTHEALAQKSVQKARPLSIVSNLVVGLTASEHYDLRDRMYVPRSASTTDTLVPGRAYRAYDLFFPLLQNGSTPAARALASYRGTRWFRKAMNGRTTSLGMTDTTIASVADPDANTSSPRDLFALAKYLYNYRSFLLTMAAGTVDTRIYGPPQVDTTNNNRFTDNTSFYGGIVISASDGSAISSGLAIFEIPFGEQTRSIVFIVMGSDQPANDIATMYDHVRANYALNANTNNARDDTAAVTSKIDVRGRAGQTQKASVLEALQQLLP